MVDPPVIEEPDHPDAVQVAAVIDDQQAVAFPEGGQNMDRRVQLDDHSVIIHKPIFAIPYDPQRIMPARFPLLACSRATQK